MYLLARIFHGSHILQVEPSRIMRVLAYAFKDQKYTLLFSLYLSSSKNIYLTITKNVEFVGETFAID